MSRIVATAAAIGLGAAPAAGQTRASAASAPVSWAQPEIKLVVSHGLMARSVQAFRPNDPLTRGALNALVAGLMERTPADATQPAVPVTMAQLDATLVRALGLGTAANSFATTAR